MKRSLLASAYYLFVASYFSLWPALVVGLLTHYIEPEWEVLAFGIVFGFVMTEFVIHRKSNWLN